MEGDVKKYVESLSGSKTLSTKIGEIIKFYEDMLGIEVKDIFITDYRDENNNRILDSLWLFTDEELMEAKTFQKENERDYDVIKYRNSISYFNVVSNDYDFKKPTDGSRLLISLSFFLSTTGELKASGMNCNNLWMIAKKYFIPNISNRK